MIYCEVTAKSGTRLGSYEPSLVPISIRKIEWIKRNKYITLLHT